MSVASFSSVVSKWHKKMQGLFNSSATRDLSRRILNLYGELTKLNDPEFALLICLADPEVDNLGNLQNGVVMLFNETWSAIDQATQTSPFLVGSSELCFPSLLERYFEAYESINGTHKRARKVLRKAFNQLPDKSDNPRMLTFVRSVIKGKKIHLRALIWAMQVALGEKRTVL